MTAIKTDEKTLCVHCGEQCRDDGVSEGDIAFCCRGCQAVYHLLRDNNLENFYQIYGSTGISLKGKETTEKFEYLADESVRLKLLDFTNGEISRVTLHVPQMYCSSCIWLLENLSRLQPGIIESRVDFPRRTLAVTFNENSISLREVVELLAKLGYTPKITLQSVEKRSFVRDNRRLITQTGIAGFAFANIMLFSFPDYLAGDAGVGSSYQKYFGLLSLVLAVPVLLYCAVDFFKAAYQGIWVRKIHIDLPLSIGILALFTQSLYEVVTQSGTGYFDSFTGLVFFLLIGRVVQSATYQTLAFDRDYKSYFPLSVSIKNKAGSEQIALSRLKIGDVVVARNRELVVADSILRSPVAEIDYSFVTGESRPVSVQAGSMIHAGGRIVGAAAEMEVIKDVSQSYLVSLWSSKKLARKLPGRSTQLSQKAAARFTLAIIIVSAGAFIYWATVGLSEAVSITTAVLIVACPCALALSIPFTFGTVMQILGKRGLFLRDSTVVESIAGIDTIVFDKTGTLTTADSHATRYVGEPLTDTQMGMLKTMSASSTHPVSRRIAAWINGAKPVAATTIEELPGQGIRGVFENSEMRLGSSEFAYGDGADSPADKGTHLSIDGHRIGKFEFENEFREATEAIVSELQQNYDLHLISGDNASEAKNLARLFADERKVHLSQSPHQKLEYIDGLKSSGRRVMMIGDGLNDSGALAAADAGIALTEDIAAFSPASDAILSADHMREIPAYMKLCQRARRIVIASFVLSLGHNAGGLYFAVTGQLSPLIAAVLMPVSSISVVGFAVLTTRLAARRMGLR